MHSLVCTLDGISWRSTILATFVGVGHLLRILLQPTARYLPRYYGIIEIASELRDLGVEVGERVSAPDITFATISMYEKQLGLGDALGRPTIIYERADSACIYPPWRRSFISNPTVIGWAKGMGLRAAADYNAPLVAGKRHVAMLAPDQAELPDPILGEAELAKISAIMPVFAWEVFRPLLKVEPPKIGRRVIDIGYTGAVPDPDTHIGRHRMVCTRALAQIERLNVLIGVGRCFRLPAMYEMMRDTKIFVSPYGLGEYSSKDYEAILCGAILVKPDSRHVIADGFDIFTEENAVPCAPDFSDLQDVIGRILSTGQMTVRAQTVRQRLVQVINDRQARAVRLAKFFHDCAARIPASQDVTSGSKRDVGGGTR